MSLFMGAWGDLTDAGVSPRTQKSLLKILDPLVAKSTSKVNGSAQNDGLPMLTSVKHVRARNAGSMMFVDLTAEIPGTITVSQAASLEEKIEHTLKAARKEIKEVRVTFKPTEKKSAL